MTAHGDEREFEHAEARNEERMYRIKSARRLGQIIGRLARVDPPEDAETMPPCSECGCRLAWCMGKGCSACGSRLCGVCVADAETRAVGGHEIEVPPLRCRKCVAQEVEA